MDRTGTTIYEVARQAGVSIATVSRVQQGLGKVAPATRQRVQRVIDELGYTPSVLGRGLAGGRREASGVVFPDLSGPYYSEVILGFEDQVAADGSSVLILATHGRPGADRMVRELASRFDGLVVMGRTVGDDTVARIVADRVPLVLLARSADPSVRAWASSVRADNAGPAVRLAEHLLDRRSHVMFVGDHESSPDTAERWAGFVAAHRARGLEPRDAASCGFRESDGYAVATTLLTSPPRPDGLMCANDEIALGAMRAAREHGLRVPDDVAVTGWDDILPARYVEPALTTVRQPMRELGTRAAELLRERIEGRRAETRHELLPTELVIRASSARQPEREERA